MADKADYERYIQQLQTQYSMASGPGRKQIQERIDAARAKIAELDAKAKEAEQAKTYAKDSARIDDPYRRGFSEEDYYYEMVTKPDGSTQRIRRLKEGAMERKRRDQSGERERQRYEQRRIDPEVQQQLKDASEGKTPSVAEEQLKSGTDRIIASQFAIANSGRSGYSPLAQRMAAQEASKLGQTLNQQTAELRAGEIATARQQRAGYSLGQQGANDQMSTATQQDVLQRDLAQAANNLKADELAELRRQFDEKMKQAKTEADRAFYMKIAETIFGVAEGAASMMGV